MTATPFLIVGSQRSGTTILGILLARHNDIFLTVNGKLLYYLITWIGRDPESIPCLHARFDEIAWAMGRKPILGVGDAVAKSIMRDVERGVGVAKLATTTPTDCIRELWYEVYNRNAGTTSAIGDKYNEYLLQLEAIISIVPEMRYVFVVRHPIAASESMIRSFSDRPWVPGSMEHAIAKWAMWNRQWLLHRERIPVANRYEFRYEDLIARPQKILTEICDFLGVSPNTSFIERSLSELRSPVREYSTETIDWNEVLRLSPDFGQTAHAFGYTDIPL